MIIYSNKLIEILNTAKFSKILVFGVDYGGVQECLLQVVNRLTDSNHEYDNLGHFNNSSQTHFSRSAPDDCQNKTSFSAQKIDIITYHYSKIKDDLSELFAEITNIGLFIEKKIVILKESQLINVNNLDRLINIEIAEQITLILVANELKKSAKLRLYFQDDNLLLGINCYQESAGQLVGYVEGVFRKHGVTCDNEVYYYIVENVENDKGILAKEVEKCCLFAIGNSFIEHDLNLEMKLTNMPLTIQSTLSIQDVHALIPPVRSENIAALYSSLLDFDTKKFYILFQSCIDDSSPISIIRLLLSITMRVIKIKYAGYEKYKKFNFTFAEFKTIIQKLQIQLYGDNLQQMYQYVRRANATWLYHTSLALLALEIRCKRMSTVEGALSVIF